MKKTIISILVCGCLLVGCNIQNYNNQGQTKEVNQIKVANAEESYFKSIPDKKLCYDKYTKIVYYINYVSGHSFPTPHYSENGKLCRYNEQEQKIEEIQ